MKELMAKAESEKFTIYAANLMKDEEPVSEYKGTDVPVSLKPGLPLISGCVSSKESVHKFIISKALHYNRSLQHVLYNF